MFEDLRLGITKNGSREVNIARILILRLGTCSASPDLQL